MSLFAASSELTFFFYSQLAASSSFVCKDATFLLLSRKKWSCGRRFAHVIGALHGKHDFMCLEAVAGLVLGSPLSSTLTLPASSFTFVVLVSSGPCLSPSPFTLALALRESANEHGQGSCGSTGLDDIT